MKEQISIINRVAIGDVIRRTASKFGNKEAVIDGDKRYTYKDMYTHTNQVANYLSENLGLEKGDKVATLCLNSYEHIIAMYGIQKAGLVWVPINPGLTTTEVDYILQEANVRLVIGDAMLLKMHASIMSPYEQLVAPRSDGASCFTKAYSSASMDEPNVHIEDRDIAQIMFTSGTTGNPKGVCISHIAVQMSSMANALEMKVEANDGIIAVMPYFHCAQHAFLQTFLLVGGKIVVSQKFDPIVFFETIQSEKITFIFALPIMYRALIFHPNRSKYDLSSLNKCLYAMAPMDQTTLRTGIEQLNAEFFLGTGQTEMYPATVVFKPQYQLTKVGSYWGEPSLINDAAIMDEEGRILGKHMVGEIVHRGPNVMICYLNNPQATAEVQKFGWHHTGDLGYMDDDGLIVFVDRKKDMIKTGGENVASIQIEQVLLNCEHVENAVVVGLPHPVWIEAVTSFVKVKDGVTKEMIHAYCKANLAGFQVPKEIILVDEFPMTSTGKIQKQKLRAMYDKIYLTVK
ncbi:class I adenylate-forming enzyme family protein [Lysinibacillus xylanilyticus]|uniref:class I adenylate-forming enzyme family protein n=1 Tax=Lysinibacillus xylanilyticus TaxID=582475 RepID=UPI003CFBE82B